MIAAGKHRARAVKGELTESGQKKTPCIAVEFQLVDEGSFIWAYLYLTEKTQKRSLESLKHCGFKGLDLAGDLMAQGLGSQEVELVVEHEEYEGKTRARVQWVNSLDGGPGSSMEDDKKAAVAARMRGLLMAQGGQDVAAPAGGRAGGDNIPF